MPKYYYDFAGQGPLSQAAYEDAVGAANQYSVSLVNGNGLMGSATLVSIKNHYGLLTADHVWQRILRGEDKDHFCMVLGNQIQRFEYPFKECTPIIVGAYSPAHEEGGPDLTFVRLNNLLKVGTIKSRKSFYPLDDSKADGLKQIPLDKVYWLACGAPGEMCSPLAIERGLQVLSITQFAGCGDFVEKVGRGGFDYVKVIFPAGRGNFPKHYDGVSGGGIWIPFQRSKDPAAKDVDTTMTMLLLAGVAYYQIPEVDMKPKTLILHGPKSIYENVVETVLHHVINNSVTERKRTKRHRQKPIRNAAKKKHKRHPNRAKVSSKLEAVAKTRAKHAP